MAGNGSILGSRIAYAVDNADRNRFLVMATVGYGLCRSMSGFPADLDGLGAARLLSEISKIVGIVLFAILQVTFDKNNTNGPLFFTPMVLTFLGCVIATCHTALPTGQPTPALAGARTVLSSAGSAALMLQWLELIASAPMRHIALAIAGAELVNSTVTLMGNSTSITPLIALFTSCFLLFACRRSWEIVRGQTPGSSPRIVRPINKLASWKTVLWVGIFSLAYGYLSSSAGLALSSTANDVGNTLPSIAVLLIAAALPQKFDLRLLKSTALTFMMAGLLLTGLDAGGGWPMQMFASAGAASCRLFAYSLACMHAHSRRISALPSCAIVKVVIIAATSLGMAGGTTTLLHANPSIAVGFAVALSFMSTFLSPVGHDDSPTTQCDGGPETARARLAEQSGLTERERNVFDLMANGLSTAEICDELFISKSTVRAHQSRIYGKLGVHTQQEFTDMLARRE